MTDGFEKRNVRVRDGQVKERPWTPQGYLLLAEAFKAYGKALFGDVWTGKEPREPPRKPEPPSKPPPDKVTRVAGEGGTTRILKGVIPWPVDGKVEYLNYEEALARFEQEKEWRLERWTEQCAAHERFLDARYGFRRVLNAGEIPAFILTSHGNVEAVPKNSWSSDDAVTIFQTGRTSFATGDLYFPVTVKGIVIVPEKELAAYLEGMADEQVGEEKSEAGSKAKGTKSAGADEKPSHPGGRPLKWDWEGCWLQMSRIAFNEGLPEKQAELVRRIKDWFISETGDHPSDSEIRKRVSQLFRELRDAEN